MVFLETQNVQIRMVLVNPFPYNLYYMITTGMPDMYITNTKATGQGMRVCMSSTLRYYHVYDAILF